jgi:hypothetical protein
MLNSTKSNGFVQMILNSIILTFQSVGGLYPLDLIYPLVAQNFQNFFLSLPCQGSKQARVWLYT